jgi:hypothetical protein
VGESPRLRVEQRALIAFVVEGRRVVEAQQPRERQRLLVLEAVEVLGRRLAHEGVRARRRPAREHLRQTFREPQRLRGQRAVQDDVGVLVEQRLAGIAVPGGDAGRDVVAVGAGLEVAVDVLGVAPVDGKERREGALVAEGDDDRGHLVRVRHAAEHGRERPPEALQGHRGRPRPLRGRVAQHLEVGGAHAHPAVVRGRRREGQGGGEHGSERERSPGTAHQGTPGPTAMGG